MSAPSRQLTLTSRAREDVRQALLFTRHRWGEQQRRRYRLSLGAAMRRLLDYPDLGQPRDDLYPGCQAFNVGRHVIFYRQTEEEVIIGRVLHVRQEAQGKVTR